MICNKSSVGADSIRNILAVARPMACHFHHLNNLIFPTQNPVKNINYSKKADAGIAWLYKHQQTLHKITYIKYRHFLYKYMILHQFRIQIQIEPVDT